MLKFFQKDTNRDKVYASVEGYQLDLRPVVNSELSKRRIAMLFFPDNTKVDCLNEIKQITQNILSGWVVIDLNSNTVKNGGECESKVYDVINSTNKNVLIISAKMAQRSFSEELIDELYLAYDKGQDGATIQKMSRALTSNRPNKVARIFSLSFDPNRDDKLDSMVFQAALNQVEKKGKSDIREELKRVYNSIDIFSCNDKGEAIKLEVDEYVKQALEKKGISRVMGKKSDLTLLTKPQIEALLNGNVDYLRNEIKERAEIGKTKDSKPKVFETIKSEKPSENDIEKVREVVISIIEHSDVIIMAAKNKGAKNITEALQVFEDNKWTPIIEEEFGVKYEVVKYLYTMGIIKGEWVNLLHG